MKKIILKIIEWSAIVAASFVLLLAILFTLARAILPHLPDYHDRVEQWATAAIHLPIHIGEVTAKWSGIHPEISFSNVEILDKENRVLLKVNELSIDIDVIDTLMKKRVEPNALMINGVNLVVRQDTNGKITVNGISTSTESDSEKAEQRFHDTVVWLLSQGRVNLNRVNLHWYGKDGKELAAKDIRLRLNNRVLNHVLTGSAILLDRTTSPVRFTINLTGDVNKFETIKANSHIKVQNFLLPPWLKDKVLAGLKIVDGQTDADIWLVWSENRLQSLETRFNVEDLSVLSVASQRAEDIQQLTGQITWLRQTHGWTLSGENLRLQQQETELPAIKFSYEHTAATPGQNGSEVFTTNYLALDIVKKWLLATNLLKEPQRQQLIALDPSGSLANLKFNYVSFYTPPPSTLVIKPANQTSIKKQPAQMARVEAVATDKTLQFNFTSEFADLSWRHWQKIPGAKNLSGTITADAKQGTLVLNSKQAQFDFGNLFLKPLPLDQLTAKLNWQRLPEGLTIRSAEFTAKNSMASAKGNFDLQVPNEQANSKPNIGPIINLSADFNVTDFVKGKQFLPVGIMAKPLIAWLDQAIVDGKSGSGNLILRGPLKKFPFDHNEGQFLINSHLQDVTFSYQPGWPVMEHYYGDLIFNNASMQVTPKSCSIFGVPITNAQASITDLRHAVLQAGGAAQADMGQGILFLQHTPLRAGLGQQLSPLNLHGPMQLNLQLVIPINADSVPLKVLGDVTMHDAQLVLPAWNNLTVKQLQGGFQFTQNSITANNIQGLFFDKPITVTMNTSDPGKPSSYAKVAIKGVQATVAQLQQQFSLPEQKYITGMANYDVSLSLPMGSGNKSTLTATSDLRGITIDLPKPYAKTADQTVPFSFAIQFGVEPMHLLFDYNQQISADLSFNTQGETAKFIGGNIHLGAGKAVAQSERGLLIDGTIQQFVLSDWQPYFSQPQVAVTKTAAQPNTSAVDMLRKIDLAFGSFNGFGFNLTSSRIQAEPILPDWKITIDSADLAGELIVPTNFSKGTLQAHMQRCVIGKGQSETTMNLLPRDVPALDISCADFRYLNKDLGAIDISTISDQNSMRINRFNIKGTGFNLTSSGQWQVNGGKQRTTISGELNTQDLGAMLKKWDVTDSLVGGKGNAGFTLSWPKAPYDASLKILNGDLNMSFADGRIINLSKSTEAELGLGRVLNLFSLQTLPRRLHLDFSDLTSEGFSFDELKGTFILTNGNANTDNASLNGPVAKIVMKGRIGLAAQDYNVTLWVTPHVTSSIPLAATVAGGPIVGAITWVASKVLSPAVSHLTTYEYKVTGSWQEPNLVNLPEPTLRKRPAAE